MTTLADADDVKAAGNFSSNVTAAVIVFYLQLADYVVLDMIGAANYAGTGLTTAEKDRIKKAEALMTVGMCLPAISTVTATQGIARSFSTSGAGHIEVLSFVKEVNELAATFMSMANSLISAFIVDEVSYGEIWSSVIMRLFPAITETPTVGDIHSAVERRLKLARGDDPIETNRL